MWHAYLVETEALNDERAEGRDTTTRKSDAMVRRTAIKHK